MSILQEFNQSPFWNAVFGGVPLLQIECLFRIFLATCFGVLIGSERKSRHKSAGVRTHAIVALGAALMMVVSKYGFEDVARVDAARIAAQVVSGVSFLGAGIIFIRNNLISGLTTAAGIWATAGIGLVFGAGMYFVGVAASILIIVTQTVTHHISFFSNVTYGENLCLTIIDSPDALAEIQQFLKEEHIVVISEKITRTREGEVELEYDLLLPPGTDRSDVLTRLASRESVLNAME